MLGRLLISIVLLKYFVFYEDMKHIFIYFYLCVETLQNLKKSYSWDALRLKVWTFPLAGRQNTRLQQGKNEFKKIIQEVLCNGTSEIMVVRLRWWWRRRKVDRFVRLKIPILVTCSMWRKGIQRDVRSEFSDLYNWVDFGSFQSLSWRKLGEPDLIGRWIGRRQLGFGHVIFKMSLKYLSASIKSLVE